MSGRDWNLQNMVWFIIRDDVTPAQLVRAQDCQFQGRRFDSGKNPQKKNEKSNLYGFELNGSSSKGTKLLFHVKKKQSSTTFSSYKKSIINQSAI